jgi:D-arginine dehydrogenase
MTQPVTDADVLVIGAGIAGASVAYELAAHADVIVLEAESRAGLHSTGRSAALFSESYGNTSIRALSRASRAFLMAPPAGFADVEILRPRGVLYIGAAADRATLDAMLAAPDNVEDLVPLAAAQAFERVPILRRERWSEFVHEPGAMDIDVEALHQGYLRGMKRRGARLLLDSGARSIARRSDRWFVSTDSENYSAAIVINAAGAWADEVARSAGAAPVGLEPRRRTALVVDAPAGVDVRSWPIVVEASESFYFKPDAGRILISPADETATRPCDAQPDDLDVAIAVDRYERACTHAVDRVLRSWAGLRTFVADRTPVVGPDPRLPGFIWLAGQGGYGIQTAPALARVAASLAQGLDLPADISAFRLDVQTLSPARLVARS